MPQKEALAESVKAPLVYVNVVIRNWQSFVKLGVQQIYSPTAFFPLTKLDYPVALGGYSNPRSPDEPMVLHHGACAGRAEPGAQHDRPEPDRPPEAAGDDVRRFRKEDHRPARPDARRRRLPVVARHCGDHRQPLAARLRARRSIRCSTRNPTARRPTRSHGRAPARWRSPIPMPAGTPSSTKRSTRRGARSASSRKRDRDPSPTVAPRGSQIVKSCRADFARRLAHSHR